MKLADIRLATLYFIFVAVSNNDILLKEDIV